MDIKTVKDFITSLEHFDFYQGEYEYSLSLEGDSFRVIGLGPNSIKGKNYGLFSIDTIALWLFNFPDNNKIYNMTITAFMEQCSQSIDVLSIL